MATETIRMERRFAPCFDFLSLFACFYLFSYFVGRTRRDWRTRPKGMFTRNKKKNINFKIVNVFPPKRN